MRHIVSGIAVAAAFGMACAQAQAQTWKVPEPSQRCPSKWGANDERGSGNHMKPASVMRAAQFIKTGEVIEIAHPLNDKMPFFGTRRFDVHTKRTFMNDFSNRRGSNEEMVLSEIGQVGTQFDGFAHQTHENLKLEELAAKRVYEFAFVMQPMKAAGFTGSTVAPVAIR